MVLTSERNIMMINKITKTIEEGLKGSPIRIANCARREIGKYCKELGFEKGVEVGVYKGEFTKELLDAGLTVDAIDPWKAFLGQGRTQNRQKRQDFIYGHTQRYLKKYINEGKCKLVRKTSMEALDDYKDKSLDFVYIDGDHTFPHVAQDIYYWAKKVRPGGIISGHDYFHTPIYARNVWCHVKMVVDAYTKLYDIDNWYVVGELPIDQCIDKGDRMLSWFWVNYNSVI